LQSLTHDALTRNHNGRYLTIDRWTSEEAFHQFKKQFAKEYGEIDAQCEALTENERLVGIFQRV
jgi:heme-degrading monooxygenase HmoA